MSRPGEDVYCTLLMSDSYLPGAAVLSNSLRDAGTTKKLAVLVTTETLSASTLAQLRTLYDYILPVERIRTPNPANLYLMGRPDLSFAFTKIALWRQTQFRKIVYLDADVVALRALDELFDIDAPFAAAPDIGWPDAFNSGVMVITPDMGEYWALHTMAATGDSFDGADQGLLNQYYEHRSWQRLNFTYNCTPNAEYQWEPAYRYYKRDISAVHFIGKTKPWSSQHAGGSGVYGELLARWWAVHNRHLNRPKAITPSEDHDVEADMTQPSSVPELIAQPEVSVANAPPIMTEPSEPVEDIDQVITEPAPTSQQRQFAAPAMEWDATKFEPPIQSRPEAANFPIQTYTFSDNHALFKAPLAYPEPPQDMWYKLPETKPKPTERPKPIFPWEQEPDRPKATRIFAEDAPTEPSPVMVSPTHVFSTVHYDDKNEASSGTLTTTSTGRAIDQADSSLPKSADETWQAFQSNNANAWDSVPGIENYVRSIVDSQGWRGKTPSQQTMEIGDVNAPLFERRNRRESLILTDFPSAIERPSLPVTPAPLRRPSFWGDERINQGELPSATGVPEQQEWNSLEKLDQLRRSSVIEFEHLTKDEHPNPPLRALPERLVPVDQGDQVGESSGRTKVHSSSPDVSTEKGDLDVTVPGSLPSVPGVAEKDFGGETMTQQPVLPGQQTSSDGAPDVRTSASHAVSTGISSDEETTSSQQNEQNVRAVKMSFTLPDFGDGTAVVAQAHRDNALSPMQTQELA